jgi:hypothetical protein
MHEIMHLLQTFMKNYINLCLVVIGRGGDGQHTVRKAEVGGGGVRVHGRPLGLILSPASVKRRASDRWMSKKSTWCTRVSRTTLLHKYIRTKIVMNAHMNPV